VLKGFAKSCKINLQITNAKGMNSVSKVRVEAGVCGFVTEIDAVLNESQQVKLEIDSTCPNIMALAEEYNLSEGMTEVFIPFGEAPLFQAAKKHLKHTACPVPSAIMKAIEVTCGLALPRDVTMKIER
jgi:hypothetical protein